MPNFPLLWKSVLKLSRTVVELLETLALTGSAMNHMFMLFTWLEVFTYTLYSSYI